MSKARKNRNKNYKTKHYYLCNLMLGDFDQRATPLPARMLLDVSNQSGCCRSRTLRASTTSRSNPEMCAEDFLTAATISALLDPLRFFRIEDPSMMQASLTAEMRAA
mmetsp:Transcript_5584/g.12955  ORF Transcript_5584/g.12955 Transcript_5584/m.12955 type:complete len:107 (+) Transcript_5584:92-412(+)